MEKNTILIWSSLIIESVLIIVGAFTLVIVFHEAYHIRLSGDLSGVCVGNCDFDGELAFAILYWSDLEIYDKSVEERNAWIFSISITLLILIVPIVKNLKGLSLR